MNPNDKLEDPRDRDQNRDPVTGATGSHPVGTGAGALAGGAAGAAIGTAGGPAGIVAGTAVGAIAGGLAGSAVAEGANPTFDDTYWRDQHAREPYYNRAYGYDDYAPAYRVGTEGPSRFRGKRFDEVEPELQRSYDTMRGKSRMAWEEAKAAVRAAWDRVERAMPGDADRDGR